MPKEKQQRGLTFNLGANPGGLFVPSEEIKVGIWDPFAPVWGNVVKYGCASIFDEVTYGQMLDDAVRRNLRIYMDQDHRTARFWTEPDIPSLAFYCCLAVTKDGKLLRKENLAGHTCADAVPLDPAAHPVGLHAFRCQVTPLGKEVLPNYQALSIHFDPNGEDYEGHPVGQVLICVSAVNGPHLAGAKPAGGQFHNRPSRPTTRTSMKKFKIFAQAGEGDDAEQKDLSVEMETIRKLLNLPEGTSELAILGGCIAALQAAQPDQEPDGDETPMEGEQDGTAMADDPAADAMKYADGVDGTQEEKKYVRRAVHRYARPRRALGIFAKEVGAKGRAPRAVLKGLVAYKARTTDASEVGTLRQQVQDLLAKDEQREAVAWEQGVQAALGRRKTLLGEDKCKEIYNLAKRTKMSVADVEAVLPAATDPDVASEFTRGGNPKGQKDRPASFGGQGKSVNDAVATRMNEIKKQNPALSWAQARQQATTELRKGA